ncbi:hypothetical protein QVN83_13525 [Yersinia frederiksenii]|uniref:hypothetical protein n=1 Tax=Yersinia frederiksenii TaxID=29484 RepID=UPI0025AAC019|nr:hypothetical protein [Yersinia frederiksenii]MDN0119990.1 hypothetical protein [Yersinia frederiksenii]
MAGLNCTYLKGTPDEAKRSAEYSMASLSAQCTKPTYRLLAVGHRPRFSPHNEYYLA